MDADAFDVLFPEYDDGAELDPIGVVASLNASLANNYSDAAIAQMKKRCQSIATSCVKSMCGTDYVNCYRNRTDIYSSLTNSGDANFDKSMNKVGGVLDYTIVLGLCVDTVKNAEVCSEHLAIETNKLKIADKSSESSWGTGSVRSDWIDAGGTSAMTESIEQVAAIDENGNKLCENARGEQGVCDTVDATGAIYDKPVMIAYTTYIESQAASTLFKDLIYDLEIEAQAKYNAKLTKQQNMCMSSNNGGILGNKDIGATFMWAKLKSNKVPSNYATAGLKTTQFVASNDLYGSFCRVRVTLQSDDKRIQDAINNGADWATAYFAAGDAFTCGSWISNDKLEELATAAGEDARADAAAAQPKIKGWMTALGAIGGGVGGAYLGAGIQKGEIFSGLTGIGEKGKDNGFTKEKCSQVANHYNSYGGAATANSLLDNMRRKSNGVESETMKRARKFVTYAEKGSFSSDEAKEICGDKLSDCTTNNGQDDSLVQKKAQGQAKVLVSNLKYECESLFDVAGLTESDQKKGVSTGAAAAIGAGVTAIAGGILANQVVNSIQNAELDTAQQAAINEFMDNVGSKIRCFIGADEVGMYGDMISTSME